MPINSKLLEILRCPVTKQPLSLLSDKQLDNINQQIPSGSVHYADGSVVEQKLEEGLITDNGNHVYRIDDDIPIMLQNRSIPMTEIERS